MKRASFHHYATIEFSASFSILPHGGSLLTRFLHNLGLYHFHVSGGDTFFELPIIALLGCSRTLCDILVSPSKSRAKYRRMAPVSRVVDLAIPGQSKLTTEPQPSSANSPTVERYITRAKVLSRVPHPSVESIHHPHNPDAFVNYRHFEYGVSNDLLSSGKPSGSTGASAKVLSPGNRDGLLCFLSVAWFLAFLAMSWISLILWRLLRRFEARSTKRKEERLKQGVEEARVRDQIEKSKVVLNLI